MKYTFLLALAFTFSVGVARAQTVTPDRQPPPPCGPTSLKGDTCTISLLDVHPTQFSVGMTEILARAADIQKKSKKKLEKYVHDHIMPGVIGPQHVFYITDHHHYALAMYDAGYATSEFNVQHDWSNLTPNEFWNRMKASNLDYLYDQNGNGPLSPQALPANILQMRDDIYRGLAWAVQDQTGAFQKTTVLFASFLWANYFRSRIPADVVRNDLNRAVAIGAQLARSPEASHLPGYIGESAPSN